MLFLTDVLIAAVLWTVLASWAGARGVTAGIIVSALGPISVVLMLAYGLRIVGLPIPLVPGSPIPNALVEWIDGLAWAGAGAWLTRLLFVSSSLRDR